MTVVGLIVLAIKAALACYLRQQGRGYVIILSFVLSYCKQDNKILLTDKCGNGRRMAGMCNG